MRNNRGSSLIFVVSLAIILNIVFITVYMTVSKTQKATGTNRIKTSSLTIAEAGKEKLYADINTGTKVLRLGSWTQIYTDHVLGSGAFSVRCSLYRWLDTVRIESWGKDNTSETGIGVVVSVPVQIDITTPPILAAVVSRPAVDLNGTIKVSGNDHDSSGNLDTSKPGVDGVSTCSTLGINGSATVSGNGDGPYGKTASTSQINEVAKQGVSTTGLGSPEEVLGLPANSLNRFIVNESAITTPFHGIRYITSSMSSDIDIAGSSGILIIHSPESNATAKINGIGTFKGIIIVDEMDKMNGVFTVIGAVVCLADSAGAKRFGNGNADVRYSSYVLNNIDKFFDYVKNNVKEISWKELKR